MISPAHRLRILPFLLPAFACAEPTIPGGGGGGNPAVVPLTVKVSAVAVEAPELSVTSDSVPLMGCVVRVLATTEGAGTGRVPWGNGVVRFYVGTNRGVPLDSQMIGASDIGASWARTDIGAGDSLRATWSLAAAAPFEAELVYTVADAHPSVRVACGPKPADVSGVPSVTTVVVSPASGDVKTGDSITIQVTAHSDAGLWAVGAAGEGACTFGRLFPGRLATDLVRTAKVVVPSGCDVNGTIAVGAYAYDAVLHEASKTGASLHYIDPTPPTLAVPFTGGNFLTTDTLTVIPNATDNNGLAWITWDLQPQGFRDSSAVSGTTIQAIKAIRARADWAGATSIRFQARDLAGLSSPVVEQAISVATGSTWPRRVAVLEESPLEIQVDTKRNRVYGLYGTHFLVIPIGSGVMSIVQMDHGQTSLDFTPSHDSLVLSLYVKAENPFSGRRLGFIDLLGSSLNLQPHSIGAFSQDLEDEPRGIVGLTGGMVFMSTMKGNLVEYTIANGSSQFRADVVSTIGPELNRSLDGSMFFARRGNTYIRYDRGPNAVTALTTTDDGRVPVADGSGQHGSVDARVFDGSMVFQREMPAFGTAGSAVNSVLSPAGDFVYYLRQDVSVAAYVRLLLKARVSDGVIVGGARLAYPFDRLRISDDGAYVVAFGASSRMAIVDVR